MIDIFRNEKRESSKVMEFNSAAFPFGLYTTICNRNTIVA